jgi:hypothetical protein
MAWEQRGNKDYYYRKKRDGDRVISEYMGHDVAGQLYSEQDRQEREKFLALQRMWREQKSEFEETDQDCEFLQVLVRGLVHATFLSSGYHPYKGEWRKKRHAK